MYFFLGLLTKGVILSSNLTTNEREDERVEGPCMALIYVATDNNHNPQWFLSALHHWPLRHKNGIPILGKGSTIPLKTRESGVHDWVLEI